MMLFFLQSDEPSLFFPEFVLYQSPSADTHYIVSARDFENRVNYFLTSGTSYQIQVRLYTNNNSNIMISFLWMYPIHSLYFII